MIPGVVVTDELLALAERHGASPDKGRAFFVDLAAKHVAVARGLGFDGVYLGGHMPAGDVRRDPRPGGRVRAPTTGAQFAREIQFPLRGEFHLFERDPETGLSSDVVSAPYLESKRQRRTDLRVPLKYRFSRRLHDAVFARDAPLFSTGRAIYRRVEKAPRAVRGRAHALEQAAKVPLFGCKDCGDCSLPEIAYVCPESQCAKNQRNGPCGGTRDGLCEVYDTECIWSQAYERLKAYGEEESMLDGPVVVKDNALARDERVGEHVPRPRPRRRCSAQGGERRGGVNAPAARADRLASSALPETGDRRRAVARRTTSPRPPSCRLDDIRGAS